MTQKSNTKSKKEITNLPQTADDCVVNQVYFRDNPQLPSRQTTIEYSPDMIKEIHRCSKDIIYFAERYFHIINLDRGKEVIHLYKVQRKLLRAMVKNNRFAVVSSRQMGKTTMFTIFALWFTCFQSDKSILIVANKEEAAQEVLSRIRMAYEALPVWLKPALKEWQKQSVEFLNGSRIRIAATSESAGRGMAINCLLVDEAAYVTVQEFFSSVIPTITSSKNSKLLLSSTPNGTNNYFYKTIKRAQNGNSDWKYMSVPWWMIPGRDEEWRRKALDDVDGDPVMFEQEYCCKFREEGTGAVDMGLIDDLMILTSPPHVLNTDDYKVWEQPNPKRIYAIGGDVSDGVGGCASCLQVIDITNLRDIKQVACYNSRHIDPTNFAAEISKIALHWGNPWVAIERNAMGSETISALMREPFMYDKVVSYDGKSGIDYSKGGIMSSTNVKYDGVSNMRYWMNTVKCLTIRDKETLAEFKTFIKKPNGTFSKASGRNVFDDRVLALIWALFVLHSKVVGALYEVAELDDNGRPLRIYKTPQYETPGAYILDVPAHTHHPGMGVSQQAIYNGYIPYNENQDYSLTELMQMGWEIPGEVIRC